MSRTDNSERQRAVQIQQETQKQNLDVAFAYVMSDPRGRLFVRHLLLLSQWDADAMTGNSQTFANLGRQAVGRDMRNMLRQKHRAEWRLLEDEAFRDADTIAATRLIPDE